MEPPFAQQQVKGKFNHFLSVYRKYLMGLGIKKKCETLQKFYGTIFCAWLYFSQDY